MVFDLVVDSAVNLSATFVIHVDDSTVSIFVSIATTALPYGLSRAAVAVADNAHEHEHADRELVDRTQILMR